MKMSARRKQNEKLSKSNSNKRRYCQVCEKQVVYPLSLCLNAKSSLLKRISHSPEDFLKTLMFENNLDEQVIQRLLYFYCSRYDGNTPFRRMRHVILPDVCKHISTIKNVYCPSCQNHVGPCVSACERYKCKRCGQLFHDKKLLSYHMKLLHHFFKANCFKDGSGIALEDAQIDFTKLMFCDNCQNFVFKNDDGSKSNCKMMVCSSCKNYTVFHTEEDHFKHLTVTHGFWVCETCNKIQPPDASKICANFLCTICKNIIHKIFDLPNHDVCVRAYRKSNFEELNASPEYLQQKTGSKSKTSTPKQSTSSKFEPKLSS